MRYQDLQKLVITESSKPHFQKAPGERVLLSAANVSDPLHLFVQCAALWKHRAVPCIYHPLYHGEEPRRQISKHPIAPQESNEALILWTSGTTSRTVKGVRLSHDNLLSHMDQLRRHVSDDPKFGFSRSDRTVSFLPWYHSYGLLGEWLSVLDRGASTVLLPLPFRFSKFWTSLQWAQPTVLFAVPKLLESIRVPAEKLPWRSVWFGPNIRFVVSGGAHLGVATKSFIEHRLGVPVLQGYGCTEMAPMIALQRSILDTAPGLPALPEVEYRLDRDNELLVRGPQRFLGYLGDSTLGPKDWFRTGDIVDKHLLLWEGRILLKGRTNELLTVKLPNGRFLHLAGVEKSIRDQSSRRLRDVWAFQHPSSAEICALVHPPIPQRHIVVNNTIKVRLINMNEPFLGADTMTVKGELRRDTLMHRFKEEILCHSL